MRQGCFPRMCMREFGSFKVKLRTSNPTMKQTTDQGSFFRVNLKSQLKVDFYWEQSTVHQTSHQFSTPEPRRLVQVF